MTFAHSILLLGLIFCYSPCFAKSSLSSDPNVDSVAINKLSMSHQRYGDWLFNGTFKQQSFAAINPDYILAQGDQLTLQIWGAIEHQAQVTVDPQGNIFIPQVGPVKVLGVANKSLNELIVKSIKRVYQNNVEVYVSLVSSQKVKVFLAGMVKRPGMYEGQSADTILRFIDQAGGIRHDLGSYRDIQVKRRSQVVQNIDLYDFLNRGSLPLVQLQDGDVILVNTKRAEVSLDGSLGFKGHYEINDQESIADILKQLVPSTQATHITLISAERESGHNEIFAKQYPMSELAKLHPSAGDIIKVSVQQKVKSISVSVKGEHLSADEFVLPWGTDLQTLLDKIEYSSLSNKSAVQLFRPSVAARQHSMLQASLDALEQNVLTTRSQSGEAANLRQTEAQTILQWVSKARTVKPRGQVLLNSPSHFKDIILQQNDEIVIPPLRNLVMVHGEVLFPTAIAYDEVMSIDDFIDQAGGPSNSDIGSMNVLLMKPNGRFVSANKFISKTKEIGPGDEIFVLAKPDKKRFLFAKDLFQVIYQMAMTTAVVISL